MGEDNTDVPHVLFYGHYDVQPVDPLNLWNTPPFEPQLEDTPNGTVIRGRGASDDKGQLMTFVEACRAWKAVNGSLPCRITFFFEGEEESGSPSLIPFMEANAEELKADIALICDTSMVSRGVPSISSQLRGMLKDEFTVIGPRIDLHSGHYGGPGLNPLRVLSRKSFASFYDNDTGRVAVEGFYEGVHEVPEDQLRQWQNCGFDEAEYLGELGRLHPPARRKGLFHPGTAMGPPDAGGERPLGRLQRRGLQDRDPVGGALQDHLPPGRRHGPGRAAPARSASTSRTACYQVDCLGALGQRPGRLARLGDEHLPHPEFEAARGALSDEWQREAVFCGMGGSIPIAGYFKSILDMDAMLIGFANDDDAIHSPNEKYDLKSFHKGIRSWARVLDALTRK